MFFKGLVTGTVQCLQRGKALWRKDDSVGLRGHSNFAQYCTFHRVASSTQNEVASSSLTCPNEQAMHDGRYGKAWASKRWQPTQNNPVPCASTSQCLAISPVHPSLVGCRILDSFRGSQGRWALSAPLMGSQVSSSGLKPRKNRGR